MVTVYCIIFNYVRQSIHANLIVCLAASGMQLDANPNHRTRAKRIRATNSGPYDRSHRYANVSAHGDVTTNRTTDRYRLAAGLRFLFTRRHPRTG